MWSCTLSILDGSLSVTTNPRIRKSWKYPLWKFTEKVLSVSLLSASSGNSYSSLLGSRPAFLASLPTADVAMELFLDTLYVYCYFNPILCFGLSDFIPNMFLLFSCTNPSNVPSRAFRVCFLCLRSTQSSCLSQAVCSCVSYCSFARVES